MSWPVTAGDIGWIEASDRDISLFLQSYDEQDPASARKHSFSDGRFIPDMMTNYTIAGEDSAAVVIQNRSGTVKIALDDSEIRIKNGGVSATITSTTVTGTAPGGFILNGAEITATGDVVTATGVSLNNHPHAQGNDSANNSQQPTAAPTPTEI